MGFSGKYIARRVDNFQSIESNMQKLVQKYYKSEQIKY